MKSAVAAIGLLAAVAQAYQPPRAFTYFPRSNTTSVAADDSLTTLTVITTGVVTITSCAPVVTNCPADQTDIDALPEESKSTVVVSRTVILTEVVCPISDVPAISSSVVEQAETGGITGITVTAPATTAGDGFPAETGKPGYETPGKGEPDQEEEEQSPEEPERTTTTTATTTGTTTITVQPTVTAGGNSPESGSDKGNGSPDNGSDEGVCECAPTVTVTAPASTVYVTVDSSVTKTELPQEEVTGVVEAPQEDPEESDDEDEDEEDDTCEPDDDEDEEEDDTCEPEEEEEEEEEQDGEDECIPEDITTTVRATVTVPPFPTNGTSTGGYPAPTGFARLRR